MKYQYRERMIMLMRPVVKVRKRRVGRNFWGRGVRSTVVVVVCFVCDLETSEPESGHVYIIAFLVNFVQSFRASFPVPSYSNFLFGKSVCCWLENQRKSIE